MRRILQQHVPMPHFSSAGRSEHQRTPEETEQLATRLDTLLSTISAGVFEVDVAGRFTYANPATLRTLGFTASEIIGRTPQEVGVIRYDQSGRLIEPSQAPIVSAGREGRGTIHSVMRLSGLPVPDLWLESQVTPLHSAGGELLGSVVSFIDVTDRFELEAARLKGQEQLHDILHLTSAGVMLVDTNGRIEYANAAAAGISGLTPQDVVGQLAADPATHLCDEQGQLLPYDRLPVPTVLREQREVRDVQLGVPAADGSMRWLRVSATPRFTATGTLRGAVVTVEDVTERRALSEQLAQAQKIEGIGLLAGGIAHDFNNLLTAIFGNAELALEGLDENSEQAAHLSEIRDAALRGAALTRQLLTFARKQVERPRPVHLDHLTVGIEKLLHRVLGEEIVLSHAFAPNLWPVMIDPGQMEQVIMNMAINARDAMPCGGTLAIEMHHTVLSSREVMANPGVEAGDFVVLSITDSGTGMRSEVESHIFEPFFTTKPVGSGSGLGLSICYGVVKQARGFISVESELGHGTTFRVHLPRAHECATETTPIPMSAVARGTGRILLAEDDVSVRNMIARALSVNGFDVLTATSGLEALSILDREDTPVDLVITDVIMPGMRGTELARRLHTSQPDVPVLFVTGYTEFDDFGDQLLSGGDNLLLKPFTPMQLMQRVHKIMERRMCRAHGANGKTSAPCESILRGRGKMQRTP